MSVEVAAVNPPIAKTVSGTERTHLIGGPLAFGLTLLIPAAVMPFPVRCALGLLAWMAWWWIARPVHLAVTSFLPLVVVAALNFTPMNNVLGAYAEDLIILLLGANILTTAWTRWNVDRRIGLSSVLLIGTNPRRQVLVWLLISVLLTAFLPNTIVAATLIPIVIAMLRAVGIEDPWSSSVGSALVLAVAWGSSSGGGFATPLGGAMNLLAIKFVEETVTHREFFFMTWTTRMLPLTIAHTLASAAFMLVAFDIPKAVVWKQSELRRELDGLGGMTIQEKWSLWLFVIAALVSFVRPLYAGSLPALSPAYVFLAAGLLCFVIRPGGEPLVKWEYAQGKMMWGLFYLFAGGTALGAILTNTGAAKYLADLLVPYARGGGFVSVLVFALITIVVAQIISHVAAIAIIVPITISTFQSLEMNPIPFVYIVAALGNCGFVLPASSAGTAIAAGYGADLKLMMVKGLWMALISTVVILFVGYFLTVYWPGFGVA